MTLISELEQEIKARKERLSLLNRDQDLAITKIAELQKEAEAIQAIVGERVGWIGEMQETIQSLEEALARLVASIEHEDITPVEADEELPAAPRDAGAIASEPRDDRNAGNAGRKHFSASRYFPRERQPAEHPNARKRQRLEHGKPVDLDAVSPFERELADLVVEILRDRGGTANQIEIGRDLAELRDCPEVTGRSNASRALAILQTERMVLWTGQKVDATDSGYAQTLVWKLVEVATPPELASAGLGVDEDNFDGRTTPTPAQATTGFIKEELGAFETNRQKH